MRLWPDSDVISSTFRNGYSGLDSGLKQGRRCESEHTYEEIVMRLVYCYTFKRGVKNCFSSLRFRTHMIESLHRLVGSEWFLYANIL